MELEVMEAYSTLKMREKELEAAVVTLKADITILERKIKDELVSAKDLKPLFRIYSDTVYAEEGKDEGQILADFLNGITNAAAIKEFSNEAYGGA